MYANQVPVNPTNAGFTADYSLIVREASKLNMPLSNSFTSMVFGFIPNEFKNNQSALGGGDVILTAVNNNGIGVTGFTLGSLYGVFGIYNYDTGIWSSFAVIGGEDGPYNWSAINDNNIVVGLDGYWSHYSTITEWLIPAQIDPENARQWTAINNSNVAVNNEGTWAQYTDDWIIHSYIDEPEDSWFLLNNNNLTISRTRNLGSGIFVTKYSVFVVDEWQTAVAPFNSPSSINNNNIVVSDDGVFQYSFDTGIWTHLPDPPFFEPSGQKLLFMTDQNLLIAETSAYIIWSKWDGTNWYPWKRMPIPGWFPIARNSKGLIVGYGSIEYLNLPLPTLDATIVENFAIAKTQLVTAFAAKYGADVPYQ
jgi:hypothetical protein